jgi:hypothetical protein
MADTLANAVFRLRQRTEPNLTFEEVFRTEFRRLLTQFRDELKQHEPGNSDAEDVTALRNACNSMSKLANWRNDRIHARVRNTEEGYALNDWRTRKRLAMTPEEIEDKTRDALKAKQIFEMWLPNFIVGLDIEEDLEKLLSTVPDLSEPQEN